MAVDDAGTIYLVWAEGDFVIEEKLLFAVSVDGGASFSEPRLLAGPTAWVEVRIVATSVSVIWVAWNADASVGAAECVECRCEVNAAGGISATDALLILQAAVGQTVSLACPPC